MTPSPYAGSAYLTTNYNQPILTMGRYIHTGARKSDAEHQATADRLIANMLATIDARTAEIVARRTACQTTPSE